MTAKRRILSVVGTRPNFVKIAPFAEELQRHRSSVEHRLVHTGQHYDKHMAEIFFEALGIPRPDVNLGVGSGSHAQQVGRTMIEFEKVLHEWPPDLVVVVGDVNATCACSITAKKEGIALAHVEAGLRSFDMRMPEEINRLVTDRLSDVLFTTDDIASDNLRKEGRDEDAIAHVGNIMIDTLVKHRRKAEQIALQDIAEGSLLPGSSVPTVLADGGEYAVLTMHRPSNVDDRETLARFVAVLTEELCASIPIVWPLHPRTEKALRQWGLLRELLSCGSVLLLQPVGYLQMLCLNTKCRLMLTDSGGLQEEACVLGTPCITIRENTERPITLEENGGTNVLVGSDIGQLRKAFHRKLHEVRKPCNVELWDGHAAPRIAHRIVQYLQ